MVRFQEESSLGRTKFNENEKKAKTKQNNKPGNFKNGVTKRR